MYLHENHKNQQNPIGSMGLVYLPTLVDFYGFHVGKYTSPMDP